MKADRKLSFQIEFRPVLGLDKKKGGVALLLWLFHLDGWFLLDVEVF